MADHRLGDVIDDYCIKCRRLTNHSIVSILNGEAAKVRCRTCYHDHDYRHETAPPSKKDLKKAELFNEVLAGSGGPQTAEGTPSDTDPDTAHLETVEGAAVPPTEAEAPKKGRKTVRK